MSEAILGAPWRMHSTQFRYQTVTLCEIIHFYDSSMVERRDDEWVVVVAGNEAREFHRALENK